ncbi:DNA adenine methylase, partial [Salmonella enterica subsp. enterica serovar Enteritidis]|nr:DNA adenine methylase [Salmonella enterica subsp. enterica serovar Enteritidis]
RSSEGHPVIVSNSDTSLTRSLYRDFTRHRITSKRSMGVAAGDSKTAVEIIATKSACWFGVDLASGPDISVETEVRAWQ